MPLISASTIARIYCYLLVGFIWVAIAGSAWSGEANEGKHGKIIERKFMAASSELLEALRTVIDMTEFQQPMTLKEALVLLSEHIAKKGKFVPILVNTSAFKEIAPDSADVYDAQVKLPANIRYLQASTILSEAIGQIPASKAEFLLRNGHVEILPSKHASLASLLQGKVFGQYEKLPLTDILQELSDQSGATIALDPRVEDKAKLVIRATFRNDVTLQGALRTVTNMAGLKMVDMRSCLYVTSTANAEALEKELSKGRPRAKR